MHVHISTIFNATDCVSETIYGGNGSQILCGMTEECHIICTYNTSCEDTVFNVVNNDISIECLGLESCYFVTIIASNVESLNMYITGEYSFSNGILISDKIVII